MPQGKGNRGNFPRLSMIATFSPFSGLQKGGGQSVNETL